MSDSDDDGVSTQLGDGSIDIIGFSGSFSNGSLSVSASLMLPDTMADPTVSSINPDVGSAALANENIADAASSRETTQMIGQTSTGQLDALYFDSGYGNDGATTGDMFASALLSPSFAGWNVVDGGVVDHTDLFPIIGGYDNNGVSAGVSLFSVGIIPVTVLTG